MTTRTPTRNGSAAIHPVWLFDVLAADLDSRFNPLAGCGRDALAIENETA
jgi:hypothetical protein